MKRVKPNLMIDKGPGAKHIKYKRNKHVYLPDSANTSFGIGPVFCNKVFPSSFYAKFTLAYGFTTPGKILKLKTMWAI